MNNIVFLISLLPVVFMIHDFEEIIFMKSWMRKNKNYLINKFPRIGVRIVKLFEPMSILSFIIAVAEEFIVLSLVTYLSIYYNSYYIWLVIFMGFFIHLIVHIIQFLVIRRYIPAIVTSVLAMGYCIYVFLEIVKINLFDYADILICSVSGIIIVGLNLLFAHKLGHLVDKKLNNGFIE